MGWDTVLAKGFEMLAGGFFEDDSGASTVPQIPQASRSSGGVPITFQARPGEGRTKSVDFQLAPGFSSSLSYLLNSGVDVKSLSNSQMTQALSSGPSNPLTQFRTSRG